VVIVSHGLTIRCFAMRFLHLTVEQFDEMANPDNCEVITIGERSSLVNPDWVCGKWGATGLRRRE
jgi:broad specificity phosphatase PhoE